MCRVSARRLSINSFTCGLLKATKKVNLVPQKLLEHQICQSKQRISQKKNCVSYLKSGKEPKICVRRNLQAQPKILENHRNISITLKV
jgi:hypothetical protein